ncbi:Ctr copper transporter family-domain-containing protein [Xylariaceae sp. FL0016]|nr:Ctr copper transporter family-domain-containing protein [Xylariaceae sp. FL0016]
MDSMSMATSTTMDMSGMTMTTSASMTTSTMDMSGMDSTTSTMMMSSSMAMVFFQSMATPLYSMSWMPTGAGSYAGTCIFLILLATVHRILIALRHVLIDARAAPRPAARHMAKVDSLEASETEGYTTGSPEVVGRQLRSEWRGHPFRIATETVRALFEVVIGGVGYLLMLAVMTLNVGYFLSVLGGIFLGTFVAGRFNAVDNHTTH